MIDDGEYQRERRKQARLELLRSNHPALSVVKKIRPYCIGIILAVANIRTRR
jgi:hypothetical protein